MADYSNLIKNLEISRDLGPQDRETNYKGRIRQVFSVISKNITSLIGVNFLLLIFCAPIIALFIFYLPLHAQTKIAQEALNFSGGIGIGYGIVDQTARGIELIYDLKNSYYLYYFLPSMMFASIGFAGAYHCCRNYLWGAKTMVVKHFFRGIARHWWKFLLTFTYIGIVGTSIACSLCQILKAFALNGSASALIWVWVVASCIVGALSALYCLLALPTYVQYNFSLKSNIKNTLILLPQMALPSLFVLIALGLPAALFSVKFIGYILYMVFATFGLVAYIMFDLAYGQYVNDNFIIAIYDMKESQKKKDMAKETKKQNNIAKKTKQTGKKRG